MAHIFPDSKPPIDEVTPTTAGLHRLYDQRWIGLFAMFMLEAVGSASWPWFGPISNKVVRDFGFTLNEVNWLGNIIACVYLPMALLIPITARRYGLKRCCDVATILLLLSGWVRYAGTAQSLPKSGAYALIIIGQALSGISQAVFRILGPIYSERWFEAKDRTTATIIIFIANPIGAALGQVLSPVFSDTRKSLLVLAIISTAVIPIDLLIIEAPPTPPSYSSSRIPSPSVLSNLRDALGLDGPPESRMTRREKVAFGFLVFVFSSIIAAITAFPILSSQWLSPHGYSDTISGLMGAVMLLSGVVTVVAILPVFDRILTQYTWMTMYTSCTLIAVSWLSLIWVVKSHNTAPLFVIFIVIGVCSMIVIPVGTKVGVGLTRSTDWTYFVLWFSGNLLSVIFVLAEGALRAPLSAKPGPPLNMHSAIQFNGEWMMAICHMVFAIRGKRAQSRCGRRERTNADSEAQRTPDTGTSLNDIPTLPRHENALVKD